MYTNEIKMLYHPDGMLDRDQRTTITIAPKRSREKFNINKIDYNSDNKEQNVQFYHNSSISCPVKKNILFHKNSNSINSNKNLISDSNMNKNISEIYLYCDKDKKQSVLSKNQDQINNENSEKIQMKFNNYKQIKKLPFTFVKFSKFNSFIVCICLWLFILQKTRALPLRMADENNHHNNHHHQHHRHHNENQNLECSDVRDVIDKILRQANISYELNYAKLDNFTQTLFKEHHQDYHNEWRHRHFDWLYPNKKQLKIDDYDKQVPEEVLEHLRIPGAPNKEELSRELTDLYVRLKILAMAIENIRADHDQNIYELMSRYPNDKHIHIVDYFKEQDRYIRALLTETVSAMKKLGIPTPNYIADNDGLQSYQGVRDLRDWIVTREHLKLLHYVLKAYEILLNRCS